MRFTIILRQKNVDTMLPMSKCGYHTFPMGNLCGYSCSIGESVDIIVCMSRD